MYADVSAIDFKKLNIELVDELRLPLVDRFYASLKYRVKCGRFDKVYCLSNGVEIIAAARFILQKSGHFLLRNLCVDPRMRNQGVARHLLANALIDLQSRFNSLNCYCFALSHLKNFYSSLGFKRLIAEQVPEDIAEMHVRSCSRHRDWILMGFIIT